MLETPDELLRMQQVLDRSDAAAGEHLRSIITAERRLTSEQVAAALTGMCLLTLATVSSQGHPVAGPVDGVFFHGEWHFGSAPHSVRFTHIRRSPWVSATHLPAEHLAITVHGRAELIDVASPEQAEFRRALLDIYVPRYGADWESFLDQGVQYARIHAQRMFTFHMPPEPSA
jgi:hypothetical protein